jgi:hypothetical protein
MCRGGVETHCLVLFWQKWAYAVNGSTGFAYVPALARPDPGTACCGPAEAEEGASGPASFFELPGSSHVPSTIAASRMSPATCRTYRCGDPAGGPMKRNSAVSWISESSVQAEFQPDRHSCVRMPAAHFPKTYGYGWPTRSLDTAVCLRLEIVLALCRGGRLGRFRKGAQAGAVPAEFGVTAWERGSSRNA